MMRLTIAIPSKGRLKDNAEAWLKRCGFTLRQKGGARGYQGEISGLDADVMLLSAREIAQGLIAGDIHIGITGQDLLHDLSSSVEADVAVIRRLGFGGANVVVAAPKAWLDVSTMADLEAAAALFRQRHGRRLRVATKYLRLTRDFFASRSVGEYRIVESAGATEAAPASGAADVIVDITSSGATLEANGLKVLDDGLILASEAVLAGGLKADWSEAAKAALTELLNAAEARAAADSRRVLSANGSIPDSLVADFALERLSETRAICDRATAGAAADAMAQAGLGPITVGEPDFIFGNENAVLESFLQKTTTVC